VENELIDSEKEWSLYEACPDWNFPAIFMYDRERFVHPHRLDYALNTLEPVEVEEILLSLPKSILKRVISVAQKWGYKITREKEEDEGLFINNLSHNINTIFYKPVPILRDLEYLRRFNWRDYVENYVISYGLDIDPRLKKVRESTSLKGIEPRYNPHTLLVAKSGRGKSEFYEVAGEHYDRATDVTLIGTARSKSGIFPGVLHGSELPICVDQLESQNKPQVARFLFGYMEKGESQWGVGGVRFRVKGRSILVFAANPLGSQSEKDFRYILDMLSHNPALGRRFGIIVYSNDFKPIKKKLSEREEREWKENIRLFRAVEEYAWPELRKIIKNKSVEEWLNTPIPGYEERVKDLVLTVEDDTLKTFFENHTLAQQRVRAAALYATLVYNLDKIALREYSIEDLLREAEERLKAYVSINLESIATITSSIEEMREYRARSFFHSLPEYLKHIISAIELYKREVRKEYSGKGQIPEELRRIRLDRLPYVPRSETYNYFSRCISNLKKKRRNLDRVLLREVFKIDIIPKEGYFEVELLSWRPLPIEPLGTLPPFHHFIDFIISSVPEREEVVAQGEKSKKVDKSLKDGLAEKKTTCLENRLNDETNEMMKNSQDKRKELGESITQPLGKLNRPHESILSSHHHTTTSLLDFCEPTAVNPHSTCNKDNEEDMLNIKPVCGMCIHYVEELMWCRKRGRNLVSPKDQSAERCSEFKPRGVSGGEEGS